MGVKKKRMESIVRVYYSNPKVQKAIMDFSAGREVVPSYMMEHFGKRPDVINYPSDIIGAVKKGATSFHCSEEIWNDPMEIDSDMGIEEFGEIRKDWDLLIDIDSKYLDYSKIAAKLILKEFERHGIKNYGVKFSGSKGFHIIISGKAFPENFDGLEKKKMFPDWPRTICEYLMERIKPEYNKIVMGGGIDFKALELRTKLSKEDVTKVLCPECGRPCERGKMVTLECPECHSSVKRKDPRITKKGLKCINESCVGYLKVVDEKDCHYCDYCKISDVSKLDDEGDKKIVVEKYAKDSNKFREDFEERLGDEHLGGLDLVLVASRHLFRAPYSLHEKSALASVVLDKEEIDDFSPKDADPLKVKIRNFLPENEEGEATELLENALRWKKRKDEENERTQKKKYAGYGNGNYKDIKMEGVTDDMFPGPINKLLKGLEDGRKRGLFILLTFLKSVGFKPEEINEKVREWNKRNKPPLKEGYLRSQVEWHLKQKKKILPPNYDNDNFYKDLKLINKKQNVKNPIVEVVRKLRKKN